MNKYRESMKEIKLSDEAKTRITENVTKHFESMQPSKKVNISGPLKRLAPLAAAAAVIAAVLFTPLGRTMLGAKYAVSSGKYPVSHDGNTQFDNHENDIDVKTGSDPTGKTEVSPTDLPAETSGPVAAGEFLDAVCEEKNMSAGATYFSSVLDGKTPEQFLSDALDDYSELVGEDDTDENGIMHLAAEGAPEGIDVRFIGNGLVKYAYWVRDDSIYVVTFANPIEAEDALKVLNAFVRYAPKETE